MGLRLVPVSPSLVGTIVLVDDDQAGQQAITTLDDNRRCVTGGGACPVGLRIPAGYRGHAQVVLGRAARPGEPQSSPVSPIPCPPTSTGVCVRAVDDRPQT